MLALSVCGLFRGNRAPVAGWAICTSCQPVDLSAVLSSVALAKEEAPEGRRRSLVSVRAASPQPCSPARGGRFPRPSPRSQYTSTASGASPAVIASPSRVPPGFGGEAARAWPVLAFVASRLRACRGPRLSLPFAVALLPRTPAPSGARCFVGRIRPSRLASPSGRRIARTVASRLASLNPRSPSRFLTRHKERPFRSLLRRRNPTP